MALPKWKVGDRWRNTRNGRTIVVYGMWEDGWLCDQRGPVVYGVYEDQRSKDAYALLEWCKPVVRVPAVTRPTAETYDELRREHGPSRYTTGAQVFKAWDFGNRESMIR